MGCQMKRDKDNTEEQLINELEGMRRRLAEFGESEAGHKKEAGKELGNTEDTKETTEGIELKSASMIAALSKEVDQLILEAGRAAKLEAEQEAEKVLKEYKQKTEQIVLKIRKETNAKAAEIVNRVKYAIELKIEETFADAMAESSRKVEGLTKEIQQIASEEVGQASAEAKAKTEVDLVTQEETAAANEQKMEFAIEEGSIELQETSEELNKR